MLVQPTIRDIAGLVYRRKWTVLLVALVVAAAGTVYLVSAVPRYRSEASIVVRFGRAAIPATNLARDTTPYSTDQIERRELIMAHVDILTSPDVAAAVIDKIGLPQLFPAIAARPPRTGTKLDAATGQFATDRIVSPELVGNVIHLGYSSRDPRLAQATLDALIEEYTRRESEIFSATSYGFQKAQADLAAGRLAEAQTELAAYKANAGISDFDTEMNALIKQGSELRGRLNIGEVALAEATQRKQVLSGLLQTVSSIVTNSSGDKYRQVDDSQARVNELQARERELTANYGADWPAARALRASIAEARSSTASMAAATAARRTSRTSEVYQNIQTDLLRVSAEAEAGQHAVALMKAQAASMEQQIDKLESHRADLGERQREVDIADSTYRSITMHMQDSRIGADRLRDGITRVAVLAQPSLPYLPYYPRTRLLAIAVAAAALLAGLFVAVLRELLDDRFVSPEQVAARLKVPVLATFDKG